MAMTTPSSDRYPYSSVPSQHPLSSKGSGHPKPKSPVARAVVGMTVLVEVEEPLDECNGSKAVSSTDLTSTRKRSQSLSHSPTPVRERPPPLPHPQSPKPRATRLTRQRSSSLPSLGVFPDTSAKRNSSFSGHSTPSYTHRRTTSTTSSRPMSPLSHSTASTTKSPYTSAPSNALDALAAHVSMSDELDTLPSSGTRGFTSLVLPRATPSTALETNYNSKPSTRGRRTSTVLGEAISIGLGLGDGVDLTRAGLAQTTMASVEVVRGIAGESTRADRKRSKNRTSVFGAGWFAGKDHEDKKGKAMQEDSETPLGFTSHRAPPAYVGGNAVLVQVWAVGLDGTDARLVGVPSPQIAVSGLPGTPYGTKVAKALEKEKLRAPAVGYIPGRSFVGRVLEVGWEVREETVRRGDWVVGLTSVQKSGALAQFVLVDRHRIHRVPQPHILRRTPYSTDNPASPPANGHVTVNGDAAAGRSASLRSGVDVLTVEELALLPLSGVPAYRAIRTFPQASWPVGPALRRGLAQSTLPPLGGVFPADQSDMPAAHQMRDSRPRALVLRAHDGPGALAMQILVREGWCVWAHVPVPFALPGPALEVTGALRDEEKEKEFERQRAVLRRIEERLRGWGVDEVLFVSVTSFRPSSSVASEVLGGGMSMSSSTHSVHAIPRSSSSSSQSLSPSPFSSSSGSGLSPSLSSSPASSGHHQQSSTSSMPFPLPFLQPYSYTPLPLPSYDTEQGSVAALLAYLTRCYVRVDAVLDTVGGREVWEVGHTLLALPVQEWEVVADNHGPGTGQTRGEGQAQFTTLVGDAPARVVASAGDNFKAGVRALGIGGPKDYRQANTLDLHDPFDALSCGGKGTYDSFSLPETKGKVRNVIKKKIKPRAVNYTWVSLASDIDWEGDDVCDSLREVLKLAVDYGVRPVADQVDFPSSLNASDKGKKKAAFIGGESVDDEAKVIPFENTPELFVPGGKLEYGGTVVSRIAG